MKLSLPNHPIRRHPRRLAFTLVEMMVVMVIFSFIVAAIVAVQLFALRIYALGSAKLTTMTDARESLNSIRDQIRAAKLVFVGNYTNGTGFTRIPSGSLQQGNAMEIAYNSNTNNYLIYYLDTTTNTLYSISNSAAATLTLQARYMTNSACFSAEDYTGAVLVNYLNNPVFHVIFQFNERGYPAGFVGTNGANAYEFYYLSTRVMRRAKE